jgi:hypothetical protein
LLGEAESSLGDAVSWLGDAKSSLGDAESWLGDVQVPAEWEAAANPASPDPTGDVGGGAKAMAMAQTAVGALVKGLLRSLWKEGLLSRDVFKTMCKKVGASGGTSRPSSLVSSLGGDPIASRPPPNECKGHL